MNDSELKLKAFQLAMEVERLQHPELKGKALDFVEVSETAASIYKWLTEEETQEALDTQIPKGDLGDSPQFNVGEWLMIKRRF